MEQETKMPCLIIELCRRCDGRFLARIVRYGRVIGGFKFRRQESDVIFISGNHATEQEAIEECQRKAETKRWGKPEVNESIEDLPVNFGMLHSHYGSRCSYKPLELRVYRDPEMHKTIQKVT